MDRHSVDWRGYLPAITTPFDESGKLNETMLRELLGWLDQEGMHGIVLTGTTGEWFSLEDDERALLYSVTGEMLKGRMTLIAGCTAYTPGQSLQYAELAAQAGFDGILLTPPPYIRPAERETLAFYRDVSDASPLPICVYNWPPGTNIDMSQTLLEQIADLDKVVAIKNSTGNKDHFANVFRALKDKLRVFGIPISPAGARMVTEEGADGQMGAGAILGREHPKFFEDLWAGDMDSALVFAERDTLLMREWFYADYTARFGSAQAIFKTALNLLGLPGGLPRRPVLPLEDAEVDLVRDTLKRLGKL